MRPLTWMMMDVLGLWPQAEVGAAEGSGEPSLRGCFSDMPSK